VRRAFFTLLFGATVLVPRATTPALAICEPIDDDRVEDEILIELEPGVPIGTIESRYSVTALDNIPEWNLWRLRTAPGADVDEIIDVMKSDNQIDECEPHRHFESPEGVQRTIADLDVTANSDTFLNQPSAATIHAAPAQAKYTGDGVIVAIIDTASSLRHPDTTANMMDGGFDLVDGNPTADVEPNGLDDDGDGMIDESDQHATYAAGLVRLAAPNARILPIRVLEEDGKGSVFSIAKGILTAIRGGARVINLSLGMTHDSKPIERAIEDAEDAGIVVVAAAGNRGTGCVDFPAYRPEALAVAAVDDSLVKTDFSSYGAEVDLSAPGADLLSTYEEGDYAIWSGTSFSTPLVAGGAALLLEKYPGLKPQAARGLIKGSTQPDQNPAYAGLMGTGALDLDALASVLSTDRASLKVRKDQAGALVRFSPVLGATAYDLASGDTKNLRMAGGTVDLGTLECIANDAVIDDSSTFADTRVPAPGRAFFYVFRDDAPDTGGGSYGRSSEGARRVAGAGDCPGAAAAR
jgi:hypothetical protein